MISYFNAIVGLEREINLLKFIPRPPPAVYNLLHFSMSSPYSSRWRRISVVQFGRNKKRLFVGFKRSPSHLGTDAPLNGCILCVQCRFGWRGMFHLLLLLNKIHSLCLKFGDGIFTWTLSLAYNQKILRWNNSFLLCFFLFHHSILF